MAIVEQWVAHPYQVTAHFGRNALFIDEEKEREEQDNRRRDGLKKLNDLLNDGYTIIDCHSITGNRVYLLHKADRKKYTPHPDSPHS